MVNCTPSLLTLRNSFLQAKLLPGKAEVCSLAGLFTGAASLTGFY